MDRPDGSPTAVDVVLRPEWAAVEKIDKNIYFVSGIINVGAFDFSTYVVTAGKTLYICGLSWGLNACVASDRDLNQMGMVQLRDNTTGVTFTILGGNGGHGIVYSKPHTIPSAHSLRWYIVNASNHTCWGEIAIWGYEV